MRSRSNAEFGIRNSECGIEGRVHSRVGKDAAVPIHRDPYLGDGGGNTG
jgi:hypothetical protein